MAICNRDMDLTEQKKTFEAMLVPGVATSAGISYSAILVPWPGTIKAIEMGAIGLSGAPKGIIEVQRFIVGTGLTTITGMCATTLISAIATSGPLACSLAAAGSTLLNLQTGDMLVYNSLFTGGNVAVQSLTVSFVIAPTQDIKSHFGSQL